MTPTGGARVVHFQELHLWLEERGRGSAPGLHPSLNSHTRDLGDSLVALIDARIAEKLGQQPRRSGVNIVAAWAGKWVKLCPSFMLAVHDHPGMLEELTELIAEDRRGAGEERSGDGDGFRTEEPGRDVPNAEGSAGAGRAAAADEPAARVLRPGDDGD